MKTRMSSLDIACMAAMLLRQAQGYRVSNVYDLSPRTYLLKLAKPNSKIFVVIESGVRFHLTEYMREKGTVPSLFTLKLRKHMRTRRVENVEQLGADRIVDFTLGSGEAACHLICELYGTGNIVLTDSHYTILTLLRNGKHDQDVRLHVKQPYPRAAHRDRARGVTKGWLARQLGTAERNMSLRQLLNARMGAGKEIVEHCLVESGLPGNAKARVLAKIVGHLADSDTDEGAAADANEGAPAATAAGTAAGTATTPHPRASDAAAAPSASTADEGSERVAATAAGGPAEVEAGLEALARAYERAEAFFDEAATGHVRGYVVYEAREGDAAGAGTAASPAGVVQRAEAMVPCVGTSTALPARGVDPVSVGDAKLVDFSPFLLRQLESSAVAEYDSFHTAVDEYFSRAESQRAQLQHEQQEAAVWRKVDKIRTTQAARLDELAQKQADNERRAQLIEYNLDAVDGLIALLRAAVDRGTPWDVVEERVQDAAEAGDELASLVHELRLGSNCAVLALTDARDYAGSGDDDDDGEDRPGNDDDDGEEEEDTRGGHRPLTRAATLVEVDLSKSAYANACSYYGQRKRTSAKAAKTAEALDASVRAAAKKAARDVKQIQVARQITQMRKPYWFEKFDWFVSSDGFLVLSGRDAQQNEILVKRHLAKADLYVHADLHGASSCVVKNRGGLQADGVPTPVPPATLVQAGAQTVCRSSAWDAKMVTSAWWVHAHQVSKTAPSGEYLPTGSFMVRGRKNFLPPTPLAMGFGVLFRLHESSVPAHIGERLAGPREEKESAHAAAWSDADGAPISLGADDAVTGAEETAPIPMPARLSVAASGHATDEGEDDDGAGAEDVRADGGDEEDNGAGADDARADGGGSNVAAGTPGTGDEAEGGGVCGGARGAGGTPVTQRTEADGGGEVNAAVPDGGAAEAARPPPLSAPCCGEAAGATSCACFPEGAVGRPSAQPPAAAATGPVTAAFDGFSAELERLEAEKGRRRRVAEERAAARGAVRHLSAKERQLLKKQAAAERSHRNAQGPGDADAFAEQAADGSADGAGAPGAADEAGAGAVGTAVSAVSAGEAGEAHGEVAEGDAHPPELSGQRRHRTCPAADSGAARLDSDESDAAIADHAATAGHARGGSTDRPSRGGSAGTGGADDRGEGADACGGVAAPPALKRGQKGKRKKMQRKYGDQDEAEREMRIALLASAGKAAGRTRADTAPAAGAADGRGCRREAVRDDTQGQEGVGEGPGRGRGVALGPSSGVDPGSRVVERLPLALGSKPPPSPPPPRGLESAPLVGAPASGDLVGEEGEAEAEAEAADEVAAILREEKVQVLAPEEAAQVTMTDELTGQPALDDVLLYALPMCGPYAALASFKHKAKLTPGSTKRGKAAKAALELFVNSPACTRRERELMRAIPGTELTATILGNVKVAYAGMAQIMKGRKQANKGKGGGKV